MFTELEKFALCCSTHSVGHYQVLECLMQVRNKALPVRSEAGLELAGDLHGEAGEVTIMLRVVVTSMIGVFREASKKHVEFAGRRNLGEVAKLYMKMEKENTMKEKVAWEFLTVAGIEETI